MMQVTGSSTQGSNYSLVLFVPVVAIYLGVAHE